MTNDTKPTTNTLGLDADETDALTRDLTESIDTLALLCSDGELGEHLRAALASLRAARRVVERAAGETG